MEKKTAKNTGAEELQTQSPRSSPPSLHHSPTDSLHHSLLRLLFTTLFSGFSSPFSCRQCQLREIELSHVSPPSLLISLPPCHLYIVLAWRFISITSHLSSSHRSNCLSPGKPFLLWSLSLWDRDQNEMRIETGAVTFHQDQPPIRAPLTIHHGRAAVVMSPPLLMGFGYVSEILLKLLSD